MIISMMMVWLVNYHNKVISEKNKQPIRYEKNFKFKISNEILITINDDYD